MQEITDCNHPKQNICDTEMCGTCYEESLKHMKSYKPRTEFRPEQMLSVHARLRWEKEQKAKGI